MKRKIWAALAPVMLLASCGGGGGGGGGSGSGSGGSGESSAAGSSSGDTLYVSFSYPAGAVGLYNQVQVHPNVGGFDGHAPRCTLLSGALPPGISLGADCTLSGRALQTGSYPISLRVGASGVSNTVEVLPVITVTGPLVRYPIRTFLQALNIGDAVNDTPTVANWTPSPDLFVSWSYRLVSGSLPNGLSLDPASGRVSGNAAVNGSFTAGVQATLSTQFGSYEPYVSTYMVNVNVPYVNYGPGAATGGATAYISQPFSLAPAAVGALFSGAVISNPTFQPSLPAGLGADAGTGVISGVPTGPAFAAVLYDVQANISINGVGAATTGVMYLGVDSPVWFSYGQSAATVGVAVSLPPNVTQVSSLPLSAGATFSYAINPLGDPLAPGLSLDPATGIISGVPTTTGSFNNYIKVTVTNNGVTWVTPASLSMVVQ